MNDDTQLARWLAGELDGPELEELKKSPRYATLMRIKENFEQIEQPLLDGDAMMESIFKNPKKAPKVVPLYQKAWFRGIAATILLLVSLGVYFTLPKTVSAPYGKTLAFTLPDNSEVLLNAGSKSGYSSFNWDNSRNIELEGEAYFEVAKGKNFTVTTSLGTVTVLGTHFNVKARENRLDVVCYEGKVKVTYNGKSTILTPHMALTVEDGQMAGGITQVTENNPSWTGNTLSFSNEKLPAVLAEIERRYDVDIQTDYTTARTFSGVLPANDIDGALKALSRLYHLKIQEQGTIILLKAVDAKR
ncbi:FecR family protein [Flavobacterium sp. RHBU_24]|uniref:FecR family protein n=1 Tax=Flavobacterium sp. RHBU_24 TaxID=3391185 RepID=UPI0039848C26